MNNNPNTCENCKHAVFFNGSLTSRCSALLIKVTRFDHCTMHFVERK